MLPTLLNWTMRGGSYFMCKYFCCNIFYNILLQYFFVSYEEFEHPVKKKVYRSPVGFCTVYRFFAFPNKFRARISQFFVLPSHQKRGIGSTLYEVVAKALRDMEDVVDITG